MPGSFPEIEAHRLEALRSYRILDTPAEPGFDDLVQLAAHVFDVPIALLAFVDRERLWIKASHGVERRDVPRAGTLCNAAIQEDDLLHVPDASRDERFARSAVVTGEPGIRFYAGVPIRNRDGFALGTLCVIDRRERVLDEAKLEPLRKLARQAARMLESRRLLFEITQTVLTALPGTLPICSHCKAIRDESGAWHDVDRFLAERASLQLTHGICDGCLAEHYPKAGSRASNN